MAYRTIRQFGDSILKRTAKPVKTVDGKIISLLDDMRDTIGKHNGVGLAAPQVGVLKRVVVIDMRDRDEDTGIPIEGEEGYYELVNPEIIESSGEQENNEACLSLPGKSAVVTRPMNVKVKAQDRFGEEFELEGEGITAVALCHEIDHLDGVLYVDKAQPGTFTDGSDDDEDED